MNSIATIEIAGCRFPIEPERSGLTAYAAHDREYLQWKIDVSAEIHRGASGKSNAHYQENICAYLFFDAGATKSWVDLVGKTISPSETLGEWLLPDDLAGYYCGIHMRTENHRIHFIDCERLAIGIDWQFVAFVESRGDNEECVRIQGPVPLKGVVVEVGDQFEKQMRLAENAEQIESIFQNWQPDWTLAESCLVRFFPLADFESPIKWRGAVYYPRKTLPPTDY